ncbi:MAG TPA: SDR family oxidoreductase, partial [Methylomirabilota bacterium]
MGIAERGVLIGKIAIVTGAATGIGRASALLFARAGARLVLADRREPELTRTVAEVQAAGGRAEPITADLSRPEDCAAVVATAGRAFGRLDVLLNNAGVGTMVVGGTVETIALEQWDLALDVNVRAMYLVSRAAVPLMRGGGGGAIVNISSVSAFHGSLERPTHAYAASK